MVDVDRLGRTTGVVSVPRVRYSSRFRNVSAVMAERERRARIITADGELIRELHLDPTKDYRPQTKP